ncbi:MAG: S1/P1 nuclease [Hyphomonadaceae bacterium]|nr:S1/P1 nuclease [Hyphomonadaceae bacterium]MBY0422756.1 S1/P1 nuclease [Parvularculaceae bacterium]
MIRTVLAALTLCVTAPSAAFAWGQTGHRATGVIAEKYLSRHAAREVKAILGNEALAEASTWPDFMRASQDPFWQREAGPWHYVTIPKGKTYAEVGAPPEGDAVTALARFRKTLRDPKATREEKALALRFAVHIIGDLQQPLHAGNGEDRGGNDFKVTWYGEPSNLHSVWDSGMIDREKLSFTEMAGWIGAKITPREAKAWSNPDPVIWVTEGAAIRDRIYPSSPDLSWGYSFQHIATVRERIAMGGVRIAAWLNETFEK